MNQLVKLLIVVATASGILGGIIANGNSQRQLDQFDLRQLIVTSEEDALTAAVEKASVAVVSISAAPLMDGKAIGSGFIVSQEGIIVTNAHVVNDPKLKYVVRTKDKRLFPVQKINLYSDNDIAILEIEASSFPTVKLGDSDLLKSGQKVIAIGTTLGELDNSVTVGVVSSLKREITAQDMLGLNQETLHDVVQIDAALNPGSSGGPLLDLSGAVVGVNFAVSEGTNGIGFSIPINVVKKIIANQYGDSILL